MRFSKTRKFATLIFLITCSAFCLISSAGGVTHWKNPFSDTEIIRPQPSDGLTIFDALALVAQSNQTLKAGLLSVQAAEHELSQAGAMSNPQIGLEAENVGGDMRGFSESEITLSLSQEINIWGQRGARKNVARGQKELREFRTSVEVFEVFGLTKNRFYAVVGTRQELELTNSDVVLAREIADAVRFRVEKGAAMESELLLAETEIERAKIELAEVEMKLTEARLHLSSLWSEPSPDFHCIDDTTIYALPDSTAIASLVDNSREVTELRLKRNAIEAQLGLMRRDRQP